MRCFWCLWIQWGCSAGGGRATGGNHGGRQACLAGWRQAQWCQGRVFFGLPTVGLPCWLAPTAQIYLWNSNIYCHCRASKSEKTFIAISGTITPLQEPSVWTKLLPIFDKSRRRRGFSILRFFPNFKCLGRPPRLVRLSSPSGYILPRSPQKRTGLGFLFFSKCLLRNTLHRYLVLAILLRVSQRLVLVPQVEGIPIILGFFWRTSSELPSMLS